MGVTYKIIISKSAEKEMSKLPTIELQRILQCIENLAIEQLPYWHKKLKNFWLKGLKTQLYRIRTWNYRIIYSIHNDILTVSIVRVGHRKDVYGN